MNRQELHALAATFATRLLGLFMIYPVFLDYAQHLRGATPERIGLALGAYGLAQAGWSKRAGASGIADSLRSALRPLGL